ncbi:hypothetical protein NA56DRAFT_700700 [Hyaloscypha hepaticicola]|uniref:Helicase C-terminal domain-containing protein n=1 Tax=Hyaloscypha hepaticicola TaxID=2082293 RepID=A0A2J6QD85_9HELO|nr:hypothetical protein NA56DRAFT_700700 [Hyaloscypha hepaticicola]
MTNSNLEPWEKAFLLMPELNPSDSISNKSYPLSYDNYYEPKLCPYAKLKRDNDDWGLALQKQKETRTKTLLWIQNLESTHPEGVDDTTYAFAQLSIHLEGDHEKDGVPRPIVVPAPSNKPTIPLPLTQTTSLARNIMGKGWPVKQIEPVEEVARNREEGCVSDETFPCRNSSSDKQVESKSHSGAKVIIFDDSVFFLDIVEVVFSKMFEPEACLRYDERLVAEKRSAVLEAFATAGGPRVLLASRGAGGLGLNITTANKVILCGPWWKIELEDQAIKTCPSPRSRERGRGD